MHRFVTPHGPLGIFLARFFPGFRFMAGPFAGTVGMPFSEFLVPNVLGAVVYVPVMAAFGYAVGYGFGDYVERARHVVGEIERIVVLAAIVCALLILGWRLSGPRLKRISPRNKSCWGVFFLSRPQERRCGHLNIVNVCSEKATRCPDSLPGAPRPGPSLQ